VDAEVDAAQVGLVERRVRQEREAHGIARLARRDEHGFGIRPHRDAVAVHERLHRHVDLDEAGRDPVPVEGEAGERDRPLHGAARVEAERHPVLRGVVDERAVVDVAADADDRQHEAADGGEPESGRGERDRHHEATSTHRFPFHRRVT
jgi:hypothetical protein